MKNIQFRRFEKLDYAGNEAINTLCTNLSFAGSDVKRIMFTSAHDGEGKSFLAMQVMRTLGKMGRSVVLVDADLRRSSVFDELPQVDPVRRRRILEHFGSPERFLSAGRDEIERVPGLPRKVAREIYAHLHKTV